MLSLLLNKNPRLSLGVVGHRLLWSVAEVSRQEDSLMDENGVRAD